MERYSKYKDSSIKWLGEIPEHWEVKRIKSLFKERTKKSIYGRGDLLSVSEYYGIAKRTDKIKNDQVLVRAKTLEGYKVCYKNDLVINIMLAWKKGLGVSSYNGLVSPAYGVFEPIKNIFSKYYHYLFRIDIFSAEFKRNSRGIIESRLRLYTDKFFAISTVLPPLKEQTQIAEYLDAKTTVIDKKINLLEQKIKHYKDYRKTLINETVTKVLDKNVKLKDSGIDWIGEIPEHWEVKRLKDVAAIFTGNSISDKSMFETKKDSFDYIATKDINIHNKKVNYDNGVYIPKTDKSFKITKKDTSLICLEGASAGNKLTFVDKEVTFVNKLCAIKSRDKNIFDKYVFYQLQSNLFRSQFFELLSGLIGGVSLGLLKYFNVIIPSKNEQQQIADYLDAKTSIIDKIIKNTETQITTLKELRKTLINEVVTGKVKVTA